MTFRMKHLGAPGDLEKNENMDRNRIVTFLTFKNCFLKLTCSDVERRPSINQTNISFLSFFQTFVSSRRHPLYLFAKNISFFHDI